MTRIPRLVLSALFTAPALFAQTPPELAAKITEEGLNNSQVMAYQDYLCNHIGHRLTGSDNFTRACEWAKGEFEKMGLEAKLEPWATWKTGWNRGQWIGRVTSPIELELQVATDAWTAPTKGLAAGRLLKMPRSSSDLAALEALLEEGQKVWLYGNRPRRGARSKAQKRVLRLIADKKLLGIVQSAKSTGRTDKRFKNQIRVFGDRVGGLRSYDKRPLTPHAVIRDDHAKTIEELLAGDKPVEVAFDLRNRFTRGPIVLNNVVAELKGSEYPDEVVIVCGHLDSWHQATGATDNGTGTCSTLEAARILMAAGVQPKRTIRFILWGGEEQGLLGSRAYVTQHRSEMHRISAVFNHDSGTNWAHSIGVTETMHADMMAAFAPILELPKPNPKWEKEVFALGKKKVMKPAGGGSDHASFAGVGVPAWAWGLKGELSYGYGWHSQWDTYDIVVPRYQRHNATVIAHAAAGVAYLPKMLPREGVLRRNPNKRGDATLITEVSFGIELDDLKVTKVGPGSLAAKAGMQVDDVITMLWDEDVDSTIEVLRAMRSHKEEKTILLTVERDGKAIELRAERSL